MRSLCTIGYEIHEDWKPLYFSAKPYVLAMLTLENLDQDYGLDGAVSIVSYFLANASTWKGEVARRIKSELKQMLKDHSKKG